MTKLRQRTRFEYRSNEEVGGLPLIHINLGMQSATGQPPIAKGIVAIGTIAYGIVSIGAVGFGVVTLAAYGLGLGFTGRHCDRRHCHWRNIFRTRICARRCCAIGRVRHRCNQCEFAHRSMVGSCCGVTCRRYLAAATSQNRTATSLNGAQDFPPAKLSEPESVSQKLETSNNPIRLSVEMLFPPNEQTFQVAGLDLLVSHHLLEEWQLQDNTQDSGQCSMTRQDIVVEYQILQLAALNGHHNRPMGRVQGR